MKKINLTLGLPFMFYMDEARYELLGRRKVAGNLSSIQKVLEALAFPPGWETELEALRRDQRAAEIPDRHFLHPRRLRALGRKVRYGRRKTIAPRAA